MKIETKTIVTNPNISESFYDYLYALSDRDPGTKTISFRLDSIPENILNSDFTTDRDREVLRTLPHNNTIIKLNPLEDVFHKTPFNKMTDEQLIEYELRAGEYGMPCTSDLTTELALRLSRYLDRDST